MQNLCSCTCPAAHRSWVWVAVGTGTGVLKGAFGYPVLIPKFTPGPWDKPNLEVIKRNVQMVEVRGV